MNVRWPSSVPIRVVAAIPIAVAFALLVWAVVSGTLS